MAWSEYNPNPEPQRYTRGRKKGKKLTHSDCVVRAFCRLRNEDWFTIYKMLCDRGMEMFEMPNNEKVWKSFLKQNKDFHMKKICLTDGPSRRSTVRDIASQTEGKRKVFVCRCAHHVVAVSNGKYYDSWDSGDEVVYTVWEWDNKS